MRSDADAAIVVIVVVVVIVVIVVFVVIVAICAEVMLRRFPLAMFSPAGTRQYKIASCDRRIEP